MLIKSHPILTISFNVQSNDSPNNDQFITLSRKLAFYNNYDPIPSADLYITAGTTQDTYYGDFGVVSMWTIIV